MMKYVILFLALVAVAAAQVILGGNAPNVHPGVAQSVNNEIRRYGPTGFAFAAPAAVIG